MAASAHSRVVLVRAAYTNIQHVLLPRIWPTICGGHFIQVREFRGKHYRPEFRKLRAKKVMDFQLPDFVKLKKEMPQTPDEMRAEMKKKGRAPPRQFEERNIHMACTGAIFESYVPPEGDGQASAISGAGAKQRFVGLEKKGKSFLQLRKIKQADEEFDQEQFTDDAFEIYKEATKLLENIEENEGRLHELVTETAYPEMTWKLNKKTFRWNFVESIEPPRVVHVRTTNILSKENIYGQITVRFHTKQTLAIYDRFGRLQYGSEKLAKDCLEYVVFEKHLSDTYGRWRIQGKISPEWMPPRQNVVRTMKMPKMEPFEDEEEDSSETDSKSDSKVAVA